jgi:organic radical activating enzyme
MSNVRYVECFKSIQGEGQYTGKLSVFLRLAGCNLECRGFGQKDPADPSTYIEQEIFKDPKSYQTLESLPVLTVGCDSSYSVSSKFKHLFKTASTEEVANMLNREVGTKFIKGNETHLVITGGEPMLWQSQIIEIIKHMIDSGKYPSYITIETNGTKELSQELNDFIIHIYHQHNIEWLWSISPKLKNVSGEIDAIKPDVWEEYFYASRHGYFKYVITDSEAAWSELKSAVDARQQYAVTKNVYIMPQGATKEQQEDYNIINKIAKRAVDEGYHISGRLHCIIFGNTTNT